MKHSKNSNQSFVFFSAIIFIVLVVIMFYTFRHTVITKEMSEGFRGGGGGHGFSGSRGDSMSGARGSPMFSAAGMRGPSRGPSMAGAALGGAALGGAAARGFGRRGGTPQQSMQGRGGRGNWDGHRNWRNKNWNNNYWWGAVPFLGGTYYLNNYINDDYGDWYPGYSYYPDWGNTDNVTNVYNIYTDKKQPSEEESKKKSDW